MVLQDLFNTMAYTEFSQLAVGNSTINSIKPEDYPNVIANINRALAEIYKKFILKQRECSFTEQLAISNYVLAIPPVSPSLDRIYLFDPVNSEITDSIFLNDVIRIIYAEEDDGTIIPIDDFNYVDTEGNNTGLFIKEYNRFILTPPTKLRNVIITYQAQYPEIQITNTFDPSTYVLSYPKFIEEALLFNIASQIMRDKTSKASEGEGYATNTYYYKYQKACDEIVNLGLAQLSTELDNRFIAKGFV